MRPEGGGGLTITESIWKSGNLPYLVANTYGLNFIKVKGIWFFREAEAPIRGLTIIERSWNYENLPYFVANTYAFKFHENRRYLIFQWGQKSLIWGRLYLTSDSHFRTRLSYSSQKSYVQKFGLDWLSLSRGIIWMFSWGGGVETPLFRELHVTLQCPSSNLTELFQSNVMCENSVRIGWAFRELSCPQTFFRGSRNTLIMGRGATFDLQCPFSNSDELFQSKVICENLVWIGWNRRHNNFAGGGGGRSPLLGGVTCDLKCPFSNLAEIF